MTGGPAPGLWVESYQQSCCDQVSVPQVGTVELSAEVSIIALLKLLRWSGPRVLIQR